MASAMVAIVGRPNVGKSTLFNRITRTRGAVVHEESGVTRDRQLRPAEWAGRHFLLVDTGGMVPRHEEEGFDEAVTGLARAAMGAADAILFIVDVRAGITEVDAAIARELRALEKPVFVVANKAEKESDRLEAALFHRLGLGEPYPVSALHGQGTAELLEVLVADLAPGEPPVSGELRVALVGRPNVGKSSLLNTLVGEERTLVSPVPGTTRDAIDTPLRWHGHDVVLVDTAGIRRRSKHEKNVEYFSVLRSMQAVERCDVAVLLLDATEGIVAQDQRVAGLIHEAARGAVVAWNKWDAIEKETNTFRDRERVVREELGFLSYAPVLSISATDRTRTGRILQLAWEVQEARQKTVETSKLNDILQKAIARNPPGMYNKGTGKVYYATQTGTMPPTFTLFVNRAAFFPRHYLRYLNNQLREAVGFVGTRIHLDLRERS